MKKAKAERIINRFNLIYTIITSIMVFVLLITTSFAWFAIRDKSKMTFTAGKGEVVLYSANYIEVSQDKWEYVWDEGVNLETENVFFGKEYTSPDYVTHLGTIDNLSFRNEINNLWYCVKVEKTSGLEFSSLRLCFVDDTPYKLFYDLENTHSQLVDNAVDAKVNELLDKLICIDSLIVTYVAPENFFSNVDIPEANEDCSDVIHVTKYTSNNPQSFEGTAQDLDLSTQDYYYVYFRAYPNLGAYADLVETISLYMPCVMQYDLMITLVVDNNTNN
jgi:hypothetical protein